jgi:catechol 1,2-dioxygenase
MALWPLIRPTEGGAMSSTLNIEYFTEKNSVDAVTARTGKETDERLAVVFAALIKHAHAFAKEVELTTAEWEMAIDFLTRTGQMCDEQRQEFILLSDITGMSMLVDAISNRLPDGATETTVMGPFHVAGAPEYAMGANISLDGKGQSCLFEGRILDTTGKPIEGAIIDVWSDNEDGYYDVQQPDVQPLWNNRGIFTTGKDGRYSFQGIKPASYPIPDDGPVGQLLGQLGRHPNRPAHMHFIVSAPGYRKIVTHTFVNDDQWLESDAVFGVKETLITDFVKSAEGDVEWISRYDFVLVEE